MDIRGPSETIHLDSTCHRYFPACSSKTHDQTYTCTEYPGYLTGGQRRHELRQLSSTSRRSPDSSFPLRFPRGAIKLIEPTFHELGRGRAREENTNYPPNEQLATHPASALILNNCVLEQSPDSVIGKFNGKSFFSHLLLIFFFFFFFMCAFLITSLIKPIRVSYKWEVNLGNEINCRLRRGRSCGNNAGESRQLAKKHTVQISRWQLGMFLWISEY